MATALEIPPCATRLPAQTVVARTQPKIKTTFPHSKPTPESTSAPISPAKNAAMNLIPGILMSSVPSGPSTSPRKAGKVPLMSAKDPLSIPIMSANFRRFVSKVGPVFWLQDRVEEVIMWRKGWKVTTAWMAAYAFLCYFPRLLLLLPQAFVIGVILATSKRTPPSSDPPVAPDPVDATPQEGTVDWQANIQAIQNLMGIYSDVYDAIYPLICHITHRTPYTPHILTLLSLGLIPGLLLVSIPYLPIRAICMVAGLTLFVLTNPHTQQHLSAAQQIFQSDKDLRWLRAKFGLEAKLPLLSLFQRFIDNNNLSDACWNGELREVELFENERMGKPGDGEGNEGWSKLHLTVDERPGWTRRQDGWNDGSVSSNLTFSLDEGWAFVESEDWRLDYAASWSQGGGDSNGWVYTNTSWLDPRPYFYREGAITRRRRWTRRIWLDSSKS